MGGKTQSATDAVPLDAAINRSTSSADKQRGIFASRQCATAGIAMVRNLLASQPAGRNGFDHIMRRSPAAARIVTVARQNSMKYGTPLIAPPGLASA